MANRSGSSSLRHRFLWTIAVASLIAIGSVVAVVLQRAPSGEERPPVLAVAAPGEGPPRQVAGAEQPVDQPPGPKPAGEYFSPRFSYSVELSGTPWKRWESLAELVPEADWGALLEPRGRFLVIPLLLGDLQPRLEALDHALLARLGIAYPSDALVDFRPIEHERASGHAFRLVREVSGAENVYHVWVLRRKGCAYLAAAWIERASTPAESTDESALDDALAHVSFDEAVPSFDAAELGPQQRQAHGVMYNDLGQFAVEARDYAGSISFFERAFELRPDDPTVLSNLVNARVELKQYAEALDELDRHMNHFADQADLRAGRAFLLAELGKTDEALAAYAALFAAGYREEGPFTRYVTLLEQQDRTAEALAAVEKFLETKQSFAIRRMQAALYHQHGEHDRAIDSLTALQQGRPFSAELAYDLADNLCSAERYPGALAVCKQLLENHYDTAHTYVLQARGQYGLKWYAEAKTSLDAAIAREPANEQAQELLAMVGAMLGEGSSAAVREAIEPVALPESLAMAAPQGVDEAQLQQYGAYLLRRHVAISFEPSKQFKLTDRRTIHLVDASAVSRFSTIQVPFDPLSEQLYVNSLRVLDGDGKEVASTKLADYYVIDGGRATAATHAKVLNIPVPGLQPGSIIDLIITRCDISPPAQFPYTAHFFSGDLPVLSALLYVHADEKSLQFKASPEVRLDHLDGGLSWRIDDPPVFRDEPLAQPREAFLPRVVVIDRAVQWDRLVEEYLNSIADRLQPDDTAGSLAREITSKEANDDGRIAALVHYVQDTLTYKPIEFGRRARVPARPAEIVRNRYGDCKDHALLLVQLLRACGIESNLVLANLDAPVDSDLPGLDQFDHMLVCIPGHGGGRFVDCTDKDSDLLALEAPLDLGGSRVLVLDESKPRFVELPGYGPESSSIRVARQVRVMNGTDAAIDETVTVEGHHAAFLREMFKTVPAANRAATLQAELSPYADAMQMQSLQIDNLAERSKPLLFKASYVVPNRFQLNGGTIVGQLPALWERMYLGVQPVPDRRTPFEVEYPLEFGSTIELIVPDEYRAEIPQPVGAQSSSSFAAWKLQNSPVKGGVKIVYELHLPAGRHPASDYAAYHDELERAVSALGQQVVLKKRE